MRKILHWALAFSMAAIAWGVTPAKKKASAKSGSKTVAKSAPKSASKSAPKSAAARSGKKGLPKTAATTWRNRQTVPTPERYREIQDALAAKGYLSSTSASGSWDQASADALKRFQAEQNIDATGKINSLSLIALGLGPRHGAPAPTPEQTDPRQ